MPDNELTFTTADPLQVRSADERIVEGRIVPYGETAQVRGRGERFAPGAFAAANPEDVVLAWQHAEPVGRALSLVERDDGLWGTFRVARTHQGDDVLALAAEGVARGLSVGFTPGESATDPDGTVVHTRAELREVSVVVWPAYRTAAVTAVRSADDYELETVRSPDNPETLEVPPMPTDTETPEVSPTPEPADEVRSELVELRRQVAALADRPLAGGPDAPVETRSMADLAPVLYRAAGGDPRELGLETRALANVTTANNAGLVPPAYSSEVIYKGVGPFRPFVDSVRRITAPASGMVINFPKLTAIPSADVQGTEKSEVSSTAMTTELVPFSAATIAGAADLSIQLILRSDPSALELFLFELAAAYGMRHDAHAVAALVAAGPTSGGAAGSFDPGDSASWLGKSWTNAAAEGRAPTTLWVSPATFGGLLDAKGTDGRPLYPTLGPTNVGGTLTAATGGIAGPMGVIHGLQVVVVPAFATANLDAVVGPASGMAVAEDGTYELTADVPGLAGRDVALVGMVWDMPLYPAAFTTFASA